MSHEAGIADQKTEEPVDSLAQGLEGNSDCRQKQIRTIYLLNQIEIFALIDSKLKCLG